MYLTMIFAPIFLLLANYAAFCGGKLIDLGINELVDVTYAANTEQMWLVEFYAPWCHHCTDLFPVLEELSNDMDELYGDNVKIAKINAILNKKKLEEVGLGCKGFPTIRVFYDATWHNYTGSRSIEHFKSTIHRLREPTVLSFDSLDALDASDQQDDFVFVFQHGKNDKSSNAKEAEAHFLTVATNLKLAATFVSLTSKDSAQSGPSIAKIVYADEGGERRSRTVQNRLALDGDKGPDGFLDAADITQWIESHNHGVMTVFDNGNFKRLGSLGKLMAFAITSEEGNEVSDKLARNFGEAVLALDGTAHSKVVFGLLDGARWSRFARKFNIPVPALVVMDVAGERQFVRETPVSRAEISAVLQEALNGELEMISTAGGTWVARIIFQWNKYYPFSFLFFVPFLLLAASFFNPIPAKDHID